MTAAVAAGRTEGFALGLALSALDAASTWMWLSLGVATEANPLIASMISAQGLTVAMGLRAMLGIVWFGGFMFLARRSRLANHAQMLSLAVLSALAAYHVWFGTQAGLASLF